MGNIGSYFKHILINSSFLIKSFMNLLQKPYYPLVQGICLRAAPLVSVHFCALCAKFEFLLLIEGCSTLWALAQVPCHRQIMRIKVVLGAL